MYEELVLNLKTARTRMETLEGRQHVVAPMVMITEGVHEGSRGPILYLGAELGRRPQIWNHRPVVVYHPEMEGKDVSACDPKVMDKQKVGIVLNTRWVDKLKAESWFDQTRLDVVDSRVADAVRNHRKMEVSTGLYMKLEKKRGIWNGEKYVGIARDLEPDHLAILPDRIGACSVEKGAGLFQNEGRQKARHVVARMKARNLTVVNEQMSHGKIYRSLMMALRSKLESSGSEWGGYIQDVYDDFVVYSSGGELSRIGYKVSGKGVTLAGEPVKVNLVTSYREVDNAAPVQSGEVDDMADKAKEDVQKAKNRLVDEIIGVEGGQWVEEDREHLLAMNEKMLEKLKGMKTHKAPPAVVSTTNQDDDEEVEEQPVRKKKPKKNKLQEYIDAAPKEIQSVLNNSLRAVAVQKGKFIEQIISNKRNKYTKEQLEEKELYDLEAIAGLAGQPDDDDDDDDDDECCSPAPVYYGANAGASEPAAAGEEPLVMGVLNFSSKE